MRMPIKHLALTTLLAAAPTQAANLMWLHQSPLEYFTSGDWQMLEDTMRQSLTTDADGVTREWKNPDSGHSGTVTPLKTLTVDEHNCRKTRFTNETPRASDRTDVTLCEMSPGKWLIYTH